jgi:hypothetical protein
MTVFPSSKLFGVSHQFSRTTTSDLPNFIETFILGNDQFTVRGMTLFASGNIIKLLERDLAVVIDIFNKLPDTEKQFRRD